MVTSLHEALGGDVPAGIAALDAAVQQELAALLVAAQAAQRAALNEAIDGGLANLPRMLRGAVRKVLF